MTVSWTNGNGLRRIVFMKQGSSGTAAPVDGTNYTASSTFGSGSQIGDSGWYAIYDGYGTSTAVTNLLQSTDYIFQAFEYNGITTGQVDYFLDSASNNPKSQVTHTPTTVYVNSAAAAGGNGTSGSPYNTFTAAYAAAIGGDTIDAIGTFTWTAAGETGDSSEGFMISKDLMIIGHGSDQTIFQGATAYPSSMRVFVIAPSVSSTMVGVALRYGYASQNYNTYDDGAEVHVAANANFTLIDSEVSYGNTWYGSGGGIYAVSTTTIIRCAIFSNDTQAAYNTAYGGGIYFNAPGKTLIVTNSSIYSNIHNWSASNARYGDGIAITAGTAIVTNTTITNNGGWTNGGGGGIYVANTTSAVLYLRNSIVAGNWGSSSSAHDNVYKATNGVINNGGYNIIGSSTNYTSSTGDWLDSGSGTATDGIYGLYGSSATGTLEFDTQASINDSSLKTRTYAIRSGSSIAVNNATTTAHNGVAIPTTDQRGTTRNGATDIGSFEFDGGGLAITPPTTQASGITFSGSHYKQLTFSWTNGNGMRRLVFMKQANSGVALPVDGNTYTASSTFGAGSQIGTSGWYAVYEGYGTSTTISNLVQTTDYIVQVFEYNGVGTGQADYLTDTATNNPNTATVYTPTTRYANYSTGNDSTGDGTINNPWKSFHKAYVSSTAGDTIDLTGTFTWSNADETGDTSDGYTVSKDLIIQGHGPDQTILQSATTYAGASRRIFYVTSNASTTIRNLTMRYGYTGSVGACVASLAGTNLTIDYSEINYCQTWYGSGGGLYSSGNARVSNSSIYGNYIAGGTSVYGGGIYFNASGYNLYITNTTFSTNTAAWSASSGRYGGGLAINAGTVTVTNSTFYNNGGWTSSGGGIYLANSSAAILYLKNTIVSGNTSSNTTHDNIYKSTSAVINNGGYNIIGNSTNYTSSTGDWLDSGSGTATDGVYGLYGGGATGTPSIVSTLALNDSLYNTYTHALSAGSIAINRAATTSNNGVSVPSVDQRGANRDGATDIGAFEYNGVFSNEYTLTYAAGSGGSLTGSTTQVVARSASGSAVTAVPDSGYAFTGWSDGSVSNPRTDSSVVANVSVTANFAISTSTVTYIAGSGGSLTGSSTQVVNYASSTTAVTAVPNTNYVFTSWSDGSTANPRTDTNVTSSFSVTASFSLLGAPNLSSISAVPSTNSVVLNWTTDIAASSRVIYGPFTNYGSSTPEFNVVSRVTTHLATLVGLRACSIYHYRVIGSNINGLYSTSSDYRLVTTGCTGSSAVSTSTVSNMLYTATTTMTMGTLASGDGVSLIVPNGYSSTSANFQIKRLVADTVYGAVGRPNGYGKAGDKVYDFAAITDNLDNISNFDKTLTMTMSYTDSDIVGITESTLKIFYYNDSDWSALSNCVVDTSAKTVTCDTDHFSTFGLFGEASSDSSDDSDAASSTVNGGIFVPPPVPQILKEPFIINNKIISELNNVYQIAVADNIYFANSSWEAYIDSYDLSRYNNQTIYLKFRSPAGGETKIYVLKNEQKNSSSTVMVDSGKLVFKKNLSRGMNNSDVKQLQKYLNSHGFVVADSGYGSLGKETSYFGALLQKALIRFQKANNIRPANGYFGVMTRQIISSRGW